MIDLLVHINNRLRHGIGDNDHLIVPYRIANRMSCIDSIILTAAGCAKLVTQKPVTTCHSGAGAGADEWCPIVRLDHGAQPPLSGMEGAYYQLAVTLFGHPLRWVRALTRCPVQWGFTEAWTPERLNKGDSSRADFRCRVSVN